MSYSSLVESSVDIAFEAFGDLVREATLANSTGEGYEFPVVDGLGNLQSGGTSTEESVTESVIDVILEETKSGMNKEGVYVTQKTLLVKSTALADPSVYDTITFDSITHTIVGYSRDMALLTLTVTEI